MTMAPVRIGHGLTAGDASELGAILISGPKRRQLGIEAFIAHQQSTDHWAGIANLIAAGHLYVDLQERFQRKGDDDVFGLLRLAMEWLTTNQPRTLIHDTINQAHAGPERVALALLDKGAGPVDDRDEEVLLEMALRGGSSALFERIFGQASGFSKQVTGEWLTRGNAFYCYQAGGNGAQLLARGGRVQLLEKLIDIGVVDVNLQSNTTGGLAHHAQHAAMIEMLAGRGLDPLLTDGSGQQAPQAWARTVHKGQNQVSMRKTWFRRYEGQPGVIDHASVAKHSLQANLLGAAANLVAFDRKIASDHHGMVDGRSLPEIAARNRAMAKQTHNGFFKSSREGPGAALDGVDMGRMLACGASEGFHYALAFHGQATEWAQWVAEAYAHCPERSMTLSQQRDAVAGVARSWSEDGKFQQRYEGMVATWWDLHREMHYDSHRTMESLLFLGEPDPNHPEGLSMAEIHQVGHSILVDTTHAARGYGKELGGEIGTITQHPQAWMDLALRLFSRELTPGYGDGPEDTYFLDPDAANGQRQAVFTPMLIALLDRNTMPGSRALDLLSDYARDQIKARAPMFYKIHFKAMQLAVDTPQAQARRSSHRL